ncbi:MAG: cysteine hydrolase family protein [Planctomycetota bacterium]
MTTLANRPNSALLVVDMQNGVVDGAPRRDQVIENIQSLVARARREGVPVLWIQHHDEQLAKGSANWEYVAELVRGDGEALIHKQYGDSFEGTELEAVLAQHGVGNLVISGAQSDFCIRNTLHGALVRGYDTWLVSDAHTTGDLTQWGFPPPEQVIEFMNLLWGNQSAPGREAGVVATAEVRFRAKADSH